MRRAPIVAATLASSFAEESTPEYLELIARVVPTYPTLPPGWRIVALSGDGGSYKHATGLAAILSVAREQDGKRWLHLSLSRKNKLPTWDELVAARDAFLGPDRLCVQVLAPRARHINIMPFCLHLWHCLDGDPVPDFARGGHSI